MKSILLTGANGGIGKAISELLKRNSHQVEDVGRARADLASYAATQRLVEEVTSNGTQFDWLVFVHGVINEEDVETTFRVNTFSLVYLTKLFLPHLKPRGGIIYISSTAGLFPNGNYPVYSASKAAVNALAKAFAHRYTEFSFVSVCPGPTNTPMREKIAGDAAKQQSPEVVAKAISDIISGRMSCQSGDIIVVRDGKVSKA